MYNLPVLALQQAAAQQGYTTYDPDVQAAMTALKLYRRARLWGRFRRVWSALVRRPHDLLSLSEVKATTARRNGYTAGVQAVPIRLIRGSEGRSEGFDKSFFPLQERSRGRWLSVATARLQGAMLPPVTLIQVGDVYFVQDGHHRISVARALGQECVEAKVIVWALAEQPAPDCCLQLKPACAA